MAETGSTSKKKARPSGQKAGAGRRARQGPRKTTTIDHDLFERIKQGLGLRDALHRTIDFCRDLAIRLHPFQTAQHAVHRGIVWTVRLGLISIFLTLSFFYVQLFQPLLLPQWARLADRPINIAPPSDAADAVAMAAQLKRETAAHAATQQKLEAALAYAETAQAELDAAQRDTQAFRIVRIDAAEGVRQHQLILAIAAGRPYADLLPRVTLNMPEADRAFLARHAETGIPSRVDVQRAFMQAHNFGAGANANQSSDGSTLANDAPMRAVTDWLDALSRQPQDNPLIRVERAGARAAVTVETYTQIDLLMRDRLAELLRRSTASDAGWQEDLRLHLRGRAITAALARQYESALESDPSKGLQK